MIESKARKFVIELPFLEDLKERQAADGFVLDKEKSLLTPCENCRKVVVYFNQKNADHDK